MTVGVVTIALFIGEAQSLKQKRMVLHSLKARLRNGFNVAVAQVADEDKWQRSTLAVAGVEKNREAVNSTLSQAVNFIQEFPGVSVIEYELELL